MADRSLVLDANILVRAVLGVRVRGLLERYGRDLDFTAPDVAFKEVEDYLPPILASRGLSPDLAMATLEQVSMIVQELPLPYYAGQEAARAGADRAARPGRLAGPGVRAHSRLPDLDGGSGLLWRRGPHVDHRPHRDLPRSERVTRHKRVLRRRAAPTSIDSSSRAPSTKQTPAVTRLLTINYNGP